MTNQEQKEKFEAELDESQKLAGEIKPTDDESLRNMSDWERLALFLSLTGWIVEQDYKQERLESFFPVFVIKPDGDASVENCYEMLESLNDPKWELIEEWREEFGDQLLFCGLDPLYAEAFDLAKNPIKLGVYEHWKGGLYQVLMEAEMESARSWLYVVYRPVQTDLAPVRNYIRRKSDFFAIVEKEGVLVPRFKMIETPKITAEQKPFRVELNQTLGGVIPQ